MESISSCGQNSSKSVLQGIIGIRLGQHSGAVHVERFHPVIDGLAGRIAPLATDAALGPAEPTQIRQEGFPEVNIGEKYIHVICFEQCKRISLATHGDYGVTQSFQNYLCKKEYGGLVLHQ